MLHAIVHFCCINTESEEIYSHDLSLSCTSLHLSLLSCEEEFQSCLLNLGELNKMSEKSSTKWRNVSILHKVQATNTADGDRVNELVGVGVGGQMKGLSLKDIFPNLRRLVILELRCLPCTSTIPRRGTRSLFCFRCQARLVLFGFLCIPPSLPLFSPLAPCFQSVTTSFAPLLFKWRFQRAAETSWCFHPVWTRHGRWEAGCVGNSSRPTITI